MYHYINNFEDLSTGKIVLSVVVRVIDPVTTDQIPIYSDENGTPYRNAAGDVTNDVTVNPKGRVDFWVPDGTYDLEITSGGTGSQIDYIRKINMVGDISPEASQARDEAVAAKDEAVDAATSASADAARAEAASQYKVSIAFKTYAQLSPIVGTAGQTAAVFQDAGTHTDPVVGGTVANEGIYRYSTSPAGWERIANLEAGDAEQYADLAQKWADSIGQTPGGPGTSSSKENALLSQKWAESVGQTPGGPDTLSSKEWAGTAQAAAQQAQTTVSDSIADILGQITAIPPNYQGGSIGAPAWWTIWPTPVDLSLNVVPVVRRGFDGTGTDTLWVDQFKTTKRVRQAYPNQASSTPDEVTLLGAVYSTDSIVGLKNNSTATSPKPVANWIMPSRLTVATSIDWEIVAFHRDARPDPVTGVGRMVACVQVRANDGTHVTPWQTVASTVISSAVEDANPVERYGGTLDISALNDGLVWLEAKVFPWVGTTGSILSSEDQSDRREFSRRFFRKDPTRAATYYRVYVASTGSDSTGVASTNDGTAQASPCLTVGGALVKLRAAAGTSRGSFDNTRIFIVDGVNMGTPTFNTYFQDTGAVIITRASGTARASAIVTMNQSFRPYWSDHTSGITEGALLFQDVSFTLGGAYLINGEVASPLYAQFHNCNMNMGSFSTSLRSNSHMAVFGCVITNYNSNFAYSTAGQIRVFRGNTVDMNNAGYEGWLMVGNRLTRPGIAANANTAINGHIVYNNKFLNPLSSGAGLVHSGTTSGANMGGFALVQNLVERLSGTNGSMRISGDSDFGNITNGIVMHNTTPGQGGYSRWNLAYDEHPSVARFHTLFSLKANLGDQLNTKSDIFMSNGARTGNFPFHHGADCEGNFTMNVNAGGGGLSFGQLYPGVATIIAGGDPLYVNYQAITQSGGSPVTGAGGGDYHLQAGSAARRLLAKPVLAYDLDGTSRGTGAQDAGCYQNA